MLWIQIASVSASVGLPSQKQNNWAWMGGEADWRQGKHTDTVVLYYYVWYAVWKGITRNQFFMPISKTSHQYMYIVLSNFVSEQNLFSKINCRLVNFLIIYTITHCSFHFQFHYEISSRCKVIKKHMTIFSSTAIMTKQAGKTGGNRKP